MSRLSRLRVSLHWRRRIETTVRGWSVDHQWQLQQPGLQPKEAFELYSQEVRDGDVSAEPRRSGARLQRGHCVSAE